MTIWQYDNMTICQYDKIRISYTPTCWAKASWAGTSPPAIGATATDFLLTAISFRRCTTSGGGGNMGPSNKRRFVCKRRSSARANGATVTPDVLANKAFCVASGSFSGDCTIEKVRKVREKRRMEERHANKIIFRCVDLMGCKPAWWQACFQVTRPIAYRIQATVELEH